MTGTQTPQPNDMAAEQKKIAASLRPVLSSLIEQCRRAPTSKAAAQAIDQAAETLAGLFAAQVHAASVFSFNEGVAAGLLRNESGVLQ